VTEAKPTVYYFDEFRLDGGRGTLHGLGDVVLGLRPKSYALLQLLVENSNRLHSRAELLEALWPDVVVTDDSLTQCVSDLRNAFGARAAFVLRTVPRRGYILTAKVRTDTSGESTPTPSGQSAVTSPASSACLVLKPFLAASSGPLTELAKTLSADLIAELTRLEGVRVFAESHGQAPAYRFQSELRISGDNLSVTVLLDDAESGATVWAETIERSSKAGLERLDGIAEVLAAAIGRHVDREDLRRARLKSHPDLSVRELCLLGRDHHQRGTEEDTIIALSLFDQAIALAPNFALAHAWQAYTVHRVITHGWGPSIDNETARGRALTHARRAVQLEPESPLCLSRLAFVLMLHQRWDEAVETAHSALRIARPADYASRNTCCEVLAHGGAPLEAANAVRRALALDTHAPPTTRSLLGRALLLAGDPETALPELRWCAARLPDYVPCFHSIIVAAIETGRVDEAKHALREAIRLQPHWIPKNHTGTWFFRHETDAERFKTAFFAAGWQGYMANNQTPAKDALTNEANHRSAGGCVTSPGRPDADLRATKPLGNA
jgi:DNA-binding winged helix-turn-helix (wHTH) protein/tetratricopeptide (TPR) repeat protein